MNSKTTFYVLKVVVGVFLLASCINSIEDSDTDEKKQTEEDCVSRKSFIKSIEYYVCFSSSGDTLRAGYCDSSMVRVFEEKLYTNSNLSTYLFRTVDGRVVFKSSLEGETRDFKHEGEPLGLVQYPEIVKPNDTLGITCFIADPPGLEFEVEVFVLDSLFPRQRSFRYEAGWYRTVDVIVPDSLHGVVPFVLSVYEEESKYPTQRFSIEISVTDQ